MKKKYIQLGAAALVLLVMIGALMFLRREPEAVPEVSAASEVIYIYGDASTGAVNPKEITIQNEYGETVIDSLAANGAGASSELTIRGWEKLSLDSYGLGQAASNASAMQAKEVITENATADDLKTFGFDNPRANVTVQLQSGSSHVILFGGNAPGSEGVYVKLKDENKIYLIADSTALPYFKPATAYVNKTITATDPEFKGFDKITLSGTDYPEPIVIERTPETEQSAAGITLNTHSIMSPVKRNLDSQKGLEPLQTVYGLLANDVVAVDDSAETLEKYGLKEPAVVISVTGQTDEMTFTLQISKPDENGEVHLIKNGSKVIYELSPSAMPFLNLSVFDMMDKMVVVPNIQTVSKVILTTPEKTYEFVLRQADEGKTLDVDCNGTPLPNAVDEKGGDVKGGENFRKLYQTMISCRYDELMPKPDMRENPATGETVETSETTAEAVEVTVETSEASENAAEATDAETVLPTQEASGNSVDSDAAFLASIEYISIDGRTSDTVSFYAGPPRKLEIRLNGESGYYGQSIYLDRLLEDAEKVLSGIAVKSYL